MSIGSVYDIGVNAAMSLFSACFGASWSDDLIDASAPRGVTTSSAPPGDDLIEQLCLMQALDVLA